MAGKKYSKAQLEIFKNALAVEPLYTRLDGSLVKPHIVEFSSKGNIVAVF
ncbi:MAG UNVERIFIED_CONTAM: hypothetical protein LVQ98_03040 [Rickettsiaceae bacterium]|jgi:hypothetical protein